MKTRLLHPESSAPQGFKSLATPVFRGSTTLFDRAVDVQDTWNHDEAPYTYGSYGTPTTLELALRLAELEGAHRWLTLFGMGYSWGGVSSLVVMPDTAESPRARRFADRLLRFYVGLEDAEDLIADLQQAFRFRLTSRAKA